MQGMTEEVNKLLKEEIEEILEDLREKGLNIIEIEVDNRKYKMLAMDYNDFKELSKDETIEEFIRRVEPEDDNELAYLVGTHLSKLVANRKESL